jgi:hypothetical protein
MDYFHHVVHIEGIITGTTSELPPDVNTVPPSISIRWNGDIQELMNMDSDTESEFFQF